MRAYVVGIEVPPDYGDGKQSWLTVAVVMARPLGAGRPMKFSAGYGVKSLNLPQQWWQQIPKPGVYDLDFEVRTYGQKSQEQLVGAEYVEELPAELYSFVFGPNAPGLLKTVKQG